MDRSVPLPSPRRVAVSAIQSVLIVIVMEGTQRLRKSVSGSIPQARSPTDDTRSIELLGEGESVPMTDLWLDQIKMRAGIDFWSTIAT